MGCIIDANLEQTDMITQRALNIFLQETRGTAPCAGACGNTLLPTDCNRNVTCREGFWENAPTA